VVEDIAERNFMMKTIDNTIYNILEKFYSSHANEIHSIFITGSFCSPYISNPHDVDYVIVWNTTTDRHNNIPNIISLQREVKNCNVNYNGLNRYVDWYYNVPNIRKRIPIYSYLYKYVQVIFGNERIENINIITNKELLIPSITEVIEAAHNQKWFYHILIDLYILSNQSYDLSPEQQTNVQWVHDNPDSPETEILYNWALEELNKYKKDSE